MYESFRKSPSSVLANAGSKTPFAARAFKQLLGVGVARSLAEEAFAEF